MILKLSLPFPSTNLVPTMILMFRNPPGPYSSFMYSFPLPFLSPILSLLVFLVSPSVFTAFSSCLPPYLRFLSLAHFISALVHVILHCLYSFLAIDVFLFLFFITFSSFSVPCFPSALLSTSFFFLYSSFLILSFLLFSSLALSPEKV